MRVIVVGGFGYIGSQVLESIAEHPDLHGAEVVVVDNWSYGRGMAPLQAYFQQKLPRMVSHCFDISEDTPKLRELIKGADYIINVASLTQIPNSDLHIKYILGGAQNLSRLILETGCKLKKIIDISSTSIYGPVQTKMPEVAEPYTEQVWPDPEIALHNYAASKLRAEKVWAAAYAQGVPITDLRLSTVFGYAVGMRYNQFINQFLVDAVAGRPTVLPGSPDNYRPFVHVQDAVGVMLHLLDHDPETNGEVINVGAERLNPRLGDMYPVLAAMLERRFGLKPDYKFASELGQNTIQESYKVDYSKLRRMVQIPIRWDFEAGAEDLVRRVMGG
ncbi:hypothetical protein WCLP8_1950003 [uncultured Gammaproteobacteria bacterium]